jgi:hypothetical protein
MSRFHQNAVARIVKAKSGLLIFAVIFVVYVLTSFDVCWVVLSDNPPTNDYMFSPEWSEHLHSSEGWTVYHQVVAFAEGRSWLSHLTPPENSVDVCQIGDYYYALAEPLTAMMLLPFYAVGRVVLGASSLIRSCLLGMIVYSGVNALLVRQLSFQISKRHRVANLAAFLFAFTTMAFSYSRLLYPQPLVTMFLLLTFHFLLKYSEDPVPRNLFGVALFYGLTVFSFNAFIITAPGFLYYLVNKTGVFRLLWKQTGLRTIGLGLLPALLLFLSWNYLVTGHPLLTPRQVVHPALNFELTYTTPSGTWLNVEGLVGSLFSPVGIFFVSPILVTAFLGFAALRLHAKDESTLFLSVILVFWLFMSLANLGGFAGRDFWVGGWANIARYMYIPSTLLVIFASDAVGQILAKRTVLGAWLVSLLGVLSGLANFSYGVRHDLMVGHVQDFISPSLLIWPYPLTSHELVGFSLLLGVASLVYPFYRLVKHIGKSTKIPRRVLRDRTLEPRTRQHNLS